MSALINRSKIKIDFNEYIDTKGPELFSPYYPNGHMFWEVNINSKNKNIKEIVKTYYHFKLDGYGNTLKYYNFLDLKGLSDRLTENPNKNDASFGKKLIYFSESKTKLFSLNDYYMILFKNWENLEDGSIENIQWNIPTGFKTDMINYNENFAYFWRKSRPLLNIGFIINDDNYNGGKFGLDIVKKFKGCVIKGGTIGLTVLDFRSGVPGNERGLVVPFNFFDGKKNHIKSLMALFGNKYKENLQIVDGNGKGIYVLNGIPRFGYAGYGKRIIEFGKIIDRMSDFYKENNNGNDFKINFCIMDNLEGIIDQDFGYPVIESIKQITEYNEKIRSNYENKEHY